AVFAFIDRGFRPTPDVLAHPPVDLVLCLVALGHRVLVVRFDLGMAFPEEGFSEDHARWLEDRALLCPLGLCIARNRQAWRRSAGPNHGSRNTARARRAREVAGF